MIAQCAQQSFLVLCRDMDLHVATLFPSELGGLGRDKGFLCRNKDRSTLCRDGNFVSRQGLGLGRAWVATELGHGRRPCAHDRPGREHDRPGRAYDKPWAHTTRACVQLKSFVGTENSMSQWSFT